MAGEAVIRELEGADVDAVSALLSACYRFLAEPDGLTAPQVAALVETRASPAHVRELAGRYPCFVATVEGGVAGFLAVSEGSVEALFVHPRWHRHGLGARLFRHAECRLRARGSERCSLTTTGYGRPFYEAMGMRLAGTCNVTEGPLFGRKLLVLEKPLAEIE